MAVLLAFSFAPMPVRAESQPAQTGQPLQDTQLIQPLQDTQLIQSLQTEQLTQSLQAVQTVQTGQPIDSSDLPEEELLKTLEKDHFEPGGGWERDHGIALPAREFPSEASGYAQEKLANAAASYAASYDPRETGKVTDVKDQGEWGICWAYSAIATMESSLIASGFETGNVDLSELHAAYFAYQESGSRLSFPAFCNAGSTTANVFDLASDGIGPVRESLVPMTAITNNTSVKASYQYQHLYELAEKVPVSLSADDKELAKGAILQYGGLCAHYYSHQAYYKDDPDGSGDTSFYDPYCRRAVNHAIEIVGWNDRYAASNFKVTPPGNGAWLVKNCWGVKGYYSASGTGYYWISYYDSNLQQFDGEAVRFVKNGSLSTSVSLNSTSFTLQEHTGTAKLTATVHPATVLDQTCIFLSGDETVAAVDQTGTIRAKGCGTCDITAVAGDGRSSAVCKVTVCCTDFPTVDGSNQPEARTDGNNLPEAQTDGSNQPEARTDGNNQPEARTDGSNQPETQTDGSNQPEARTDGNNQPEARTDGNNLPGIRTDGSNIWDRQTGQITPGNAEMENDGQGVSAVKVGMTFRYLRYYIYKVTAADEVMLTGYMMDGGCFVTIPDTVQYRNRIFRVTAVGDKAFYKQKSLRSVRFGENTEAIGKRAFYGCSKLKSVTIPTGVTSIGSKAFYGCSKLKTVTIKSDTLRKVGGGAFKKLAKKATIKVPRAKYASYKRLFKKNYSSGTKIKKQSDGIKKVRVERHGFFRAYKEETKEWRIFIPNNRELQQIKLYYTE